MRAAVVFVLLLVAVASPAFAQPTIAESGWTLLRTIDFTNPVSACYNPVDGNIYVGARSSGADGLYRVDRFGLKIRIASGSNPAGVCVHPDSGSIFVSEDYGGYLYRTALGATGRQTWVSGLHDGDDDPVGMAIAPADYVGSVLAPGEALVVDRGNSGLDEIWRWSPLVAEGETVIHADNGTLVDAVDVAIDSTTVFVVDTKLTATGVVYEVGPGGTLTPFATSEPLPDPAGIVIDPWNGDLLILDQADHRVVRVDRTTGAVSTVISDLLTGFAWCGVDISPDGRQLLVTDWTAGQIHVFGRCDAAGQPELDCNGNGQYDLCDITLGLATDCNENSVPDSCDLESGTSEDCNLDGVPDECPFCPPVELIFIMDTSTSMDDEASALCSSLGAVTTRLESAGLAVTDSLLAICDLPGGAYSCLEDYITNVLGVVVPGSPPPEIDTLGACPGGDQVCQEDWGRATAVVAGLYPWQPEGASVRLIIPLSDEGPWCGSPETAYDQQSIDHAILVARANGVIVSPITGSGSSTAVLNLAQQLADSTEGQHFRSTTAITDIAEGIVSLVLAACFSASDCNGNGVLDECDIGAGTSQDTNGNGVPDECETVIGVPDREPLHGGFLLHHPYPNPLAGNATRIGFELPRASMVRLSIHAVDGRLVATLVSGPKPAGQHEAVWDGRDDRGRRVSAGQYLVRFSADGIVRSSKLVLLR